MIILAYFWRDLDYEEEGPIDYFSSGLFEQTYEERFELYPFRLR